MLVYVCLCNTQVLFWGVHMTFQKESEPVHGQASDHPMGDVQFLDIPSLVLPLQPDLPFGYD